MLLGRKEAILTLAPTGETPWKKEKAVGNPQRSWGLTNKESTIKLRG
jgi:hypothetical protein